MKWKQLTQQQNNKNTKEMKLNKSAFENYTFTNENTVT